MNIHFAICTYLLSFYFEQLYEASSLKWDIPFIQVCFLNFKNLLAMPFIFRLLYTYVYKLSYVYSLLIVVCSSGVINEVGALSAKEQDQDLETVAIILIVQDQDHQSIDGIVNIEIRKTEKSLGSIGDRLVSEILTVQIKLKRSRNNFSNI